MTAIFRANESLKQTQVGLFYDKYEGTFPDSPF
jgi:hypothetical protein